MMHCSRHMECDRLNWCDDMHTCRPCAVFKRDDPSSSSDGAFPHTCIKEGHRNSHAVPSRRSLCKAQATTTERPPLFRLPNGSLLPRARRPGCTFVTGATASLARQLPGVLCVVQRLHQLGSRHNVVVLAPIEDVPLAVAALPSNVTVLSTSRFPYEYTPSNGGRSWSSRFVGRRILDKLLLLGAPFERLVWLDSDTFLLENVDELCNIKSRFAAALNDGFEPRTCFFTSPHKYDECEQCRVRGPVGEHVPACQHHGISRDEIAESFWVRLNLRYFEAHRNESAHLWRRTLKPCVYEFNTGVLSVAPLGVRAFRRLVWEPVLCHQVHSRDQGDQGAFNTLVQRDRIFDDSVTLLPSTFNTLLQLYQRQGRRRSPSALPKVLHLSGPRKPWFKDGESSTDTDTTRVWMGHCDTAMVQAARYKQHRVSDSVVSSRLSVWS